MTQTGLDMSRVYIYQDWCTYICSTEQNRRFISI